MWQQGGEGAGATDDGVWGCTAEQGVEVVQMSSTSPPGLPKAA